jgi:hypothetical protein
VSASLFLRQNINLCFEFSVRLHSTRLANDLHHQHKKKKKANQKNGINKDVSQPESSANSNEYQVDCDALAVDKNNKKCPLRTLIRTATHLTTLHFVSLETTNQKTHVVSCLYQQNTR